MGGNPKGSPWRNTPNDMRGRPGITVRMSREGAATLDQRCMSLDPERKIGRGEVIEGLLATDDRIRALLKQWENELDRGDMHVAARAALVLASDDLRDALGIPRIFSSHTANDAPDRSG